jgi:hypothetical protein
MFYFYSNLNLSLEELFGSRFLEIPIGILLSLPFLDFPLLIGILSELSNFPEL